MPPLPVLAVARQIFVTQIEADRAIRFLQEHSQMQFEMLLHAGTLPLLRMYKPERQGIRLVAFSEMAEALEEASDEDKLPEPLSYLGVLDTVFELERRFRRAFGLDDLNIQGDAFTADPDSPGRSIPGGGSSTNSKILNTIFE